MKNNILLAALATVAFVGCATSHDRYSRNDRDGRYYVTEEHPGTRTIIVDRNGDRTYVRERDYQDNDYRGSAYYQNNMEPRVRGKHAESLGWNTENYYIQRGY
jgi:hypothetical protein